MAWFQVFKLIPQTSSINSWINVYDPYVSYKPPQISIPSYRPFKGHSKDIKYMIIAQWMDVQSRDEIWEFQTSFNNNSSKKYPMNKCQIILESCI
jgi:hypothetical protein